uniref:Midasin-like n=1 Tax=Diabrotica virgifera virgifera TaxID=50390 RepID=A0A6P7F5I1_DIAVI
MWLLTDYSRHLDEIARELERVCLEVNQEFLVNGKNGDALRLMQHWETYRQLSDTPSSSMEEEIKLFLRKISRLEDVAQFISSYHQESVVAALTDRLQKISFAIKNEASLNAGGKFEWVDSVLIKCLQDGSWLLVDNVNLCSSAVLDRLNALLEPNGVLTVSERGVDANGQMVEIKPHKDFRLFLTMDPRNGEISRAMRNRGIEIYLLNEGELQHSHDIDRSSLIQLEGLSSFHAEMLIKLHNFISEHVIGERPNVNEMIQVSTLAAQQLKYGVDSQQTFTSTILEVYYKTRSPLEFSCTNFETVMSEEITKLLNGESSTVPACFDSNATLKTQEISLNSSIEKVKQQAVLLFDYLENAVKTCADVDVKLGHLLVCFYSTTSLEDISVRHRYLQAKIKSSKPLTPSLQNLLLNFTNKLLYICQRSSNALSLPVDHNWIPEISTLEETLESNTQMLPLFFSVDSLLENTNLANISGNRIEFDGKKLKFNKPKKGSKLTLVEYSRYLQQGLLEDRFGDVVVNNFTNLTKTYNDFLLNIVNMTKSISNHDIIELLYMLFWKSKLVELLHFNYSADVDQKQLRKVFAELPVHYKWFYKFSVQAVSKITNLPVLESLEDILKQINSKLDKQFSVMHKLGKNYQKSSNRPPPYTSKEHYDIIYKFNEISERYNSSRKGNDVLDLFNSFYGNKGLRSSLVEFKAELDYGFSNFDEKIEKIKEISNKISCKNLEPCTKFELQLVPLLDHLMHLQIRHNISTGHDMALINNVLIPTELCGTLLLYHRTKDPRLSYELYRHYYQYLMLSPSAQPSKFLGEEEEKEIHEFAPKITFLLSNLLINAKGVEDLGRVTLGNFRHLMKQHDVLNLTLWGNLYQLSEEEYSFMYCEKQNITKVYTKFLQELALSLKITTENKTDDTINILVQNILKKLRDVHSSDAHPELTALLDKIKYSFLKFEQLQKVLELDQFLLTVSCLYQSVSYLKAKFNSKLSSIDPLAKKTLKRNYCAEAMKMFDVLRLCYDSLNQIYSDKKETMHDYCKQIEVLQTKLQSKHRELSKYVAYRPDDVLYSSVAEVISYAFSTLLADDYIVEVNEATRQQVIRERSNKGSIFCILYFGVFWLLKIFQKTSSQKRNDFYKDSNVEEVKSCYHVLEDLKIKINELLEEWPDQPTLNTILTVIDRIYKFEITSPISRYLTGFEILLTKCHEWEEVAHSGVSISQHTQNLTNQIVTWRKLELAVWKDLLSKVHDRLNEPLPKWWLHLYNVMHQFIQERKFGEKELVETLQTFITKSNMAEFQGRLNLLYAFHCHATYLEHTEETESFINILWNVYSYFRQFVDVVSKKIKDLKSPIEKKLKDYVKIVRWKDINYWAIKDTVEKSHKNIHKFMREYQAALEQPVSPCIHNIDPESSSQKVGIWDKPKNGKSPDFYSHYLTSEIDNYLSDQQEIQHSIESASGSTKRLLDKATKVRELSRQIILATTYPALIQDLDVFVTEVIETSSHLQKLEVDTTLTKEKQKSQAKNILQRKHRALADLFKSLTKMGLSFKTGIVDSKVKDPTAEFLIKPIDLQSQFHNENYGYKEDRILSFWESSEKYYVRSLMRFDVLETALQSPSKELGMQNVERVKGFSQDMLTSIQHQKNKLVEASRVYYYIRHYARQLKQFSNAKEYLPCNLIDGITDLLSKINSTMSHYQIVLNTCPVENSFNSENVQILILKTDLENRIVYKHDKYWSKATTIISNIQSSCRKLISQLFKAKAEIPTSDFQCLKNQYVSITNLSELTKNLSNVHEEILSLKTIFGNTKLTNNLLVLADEVQQATSNLQNPVLTKTSIDGDISTKCEKEIKKLSKKILSTVTDLHKKYEAIPKPKDEAEENEESIQEDHLTKYLVDNLSTDISQLNMQVILEEINQIASYIMGASLENIDKRKTLASQVCHVLDQAILLQRYFVTQQIAVYRVSCKMASVLLNVFIELASKGFCIPPEFSDEFDKEGISKPSDGLGLGEGQGERDVSDKIESEDQLDDAQPAGQEKDNEEDKDCKEEEKGIEMSEDFDSKLQDKEKKDDDDSNSESGDSDADEQMGETEKGAEQQNTETFGDDKEEGDGEEEEGPEQKEEKGEKGEKEGEEQLGAKEGKTANDEEDQKEGKEEKEKNKKEINEMEEPEYDDDQIDPHHGQQQELPEPEPMDLPEDMQLDDGEAKDEENDDKQDENPFDIDTMKTDEKPDDKNDEAADENKDDESKRDDEKDFSSDDEDVERGDKKDGEEGADGEDDENKDDDGVKESEKADKEDDANSENGDESALDQTESHQENIEAMEVDDADAADKAQASKSENQQSNQPIDELQQEDQRDQEGVGQSQMEETSSGHTAQTSAPQEIKRAKDNRDKEEQKRKQKPGDSDSKRSLGDVDQPVRKKLKTVEAKNDSEQDKEDKRDEDADMYQHIEDAEKSKTQVLDVATKEQAENQKKETHHEEEKDEDPAESSKDLPEEEETDVIDVDTAESEVAEKLGETKDQKSKKQQHPQGDVLEEVQEIEIEGELVQTSTVPRSTESTHHTQYSTIAETTASRLSMEEINSLRLDVEKQLSGWNDPPSTIEADQAWQKISSVTSSLAQDLSEQLRLVLEPTQASRLRGDFRTGRRINMRKVIPYIASQFRKDKIWLRRTKPSKREYQIVLAIDDSSSMNDNHSKELAFESVALISKALTLLESGQLSVLSFGENVEVIHKLTDQFTDRSGIKLLQKFKFDQNKTCVAKLVDFSTEMFNQSQLQSTALNAKLLVIVSDGRGVFSEGETFVKQAVRRGKLSNIFMVFVIIDNPENKNSVLDIRMPVFKDGKLQEIQNYMDVFPFSFYIILRDINSLPSVLSDALRQWFEIVSNLDK